MACPKCGCKVAYQYDPGGDCMERCAACGEIFDIEDHTYEDDMDEEQNSSCKTAPGGPAGALRPDEQSPLGPAPLDATS